MAIVKKGAAARNRRILEALRDDKAIEAAVVRAVTRAVKAARPKRNSTSRARTIAEKLRGGKAIDAAAARAVERAVRESKRACKQSRA